MDVSQTEKGGSFELDSADFSNFIYSRKLSVVDLLYPVTSREQRS